jgi:cell division inhibitor SepF
VLVALSDTWHRALVYFGLAEERDEYDDDDLEPEPAAERDRERERDRPNVRRLSSSSRRRRDDFDDIFSDDEPPTRAVLRPVGGGGSGSSGGGGGARNRNGSVKLHLVIPKSFNDAQQVADKFKDDIPVVLNLQGTETDLSKRLIDFASGLTYALDGGMQRVADRVFMLTPRNVEISAEERAQLIEKGFFNQS